MANFFKKKGGGQVTTSAIQMTDSEAALAQSDFNIEKITEVQSKFTGGMILVYPGRIFIREGLLWKVCRKGLKKRQFFLFNDILVYGSVVANRYSNQHILPLSQMSVSAECFYQPRVNADFDEESEQMELDVANAFQISHANKSFHVFALSSADKANWLANLHKHINRVALSVSGDNQLMTKPVWVPDSMSKECMVCSIKFTAFVRKHHCRRCGRVVCSSCSPHRMAIDPLTQNGTELESKKLERVCKDCFKEMSSINVRSGGSLTDKPPPPASVAAQAVSSILSSNKIAQSTQLSDGKGQEHDSSTDTEDSDDSENEQEVAAPDLPVPVDDPSGPAETPAECESQPTPPPRKKKLKKKLEQIVEKQLNRDGEAITAEPEESKVMTSKQEESTLQEETNTEDTNVTSLENQCINRELEDLSGEDKHLSTAESPKKSRRRKKHVRSPNMDDEGKVGRDDDDRDSEHESHQVNEEESVKQENDEQANSEQNSDVLTTSTRKAKTRKSKFK